MFHPTSSFSSRSVRKRTSPEPAEGQNDPVGIKPITLLAIQFSKTERYPSIRDAALEPSLVRVAESRRLPAASRRGGVSTSAAPCRQESFERMTRSLSWRRESISTSTRLSPSSPLPGLVSAVLRWRRALLLPLRRGPVNSSELLSRRRSVGAVSSPDHRVPSSAELQEFSLPSSWLLRRAGRDF